MCGFNTALLWKSWGNNDDLQQGHAKQADDDCGDKRREAENCEVEQDVSRKSQDQSAHDQD